DRSISELESLQKTETKIIKESNIDKVCIRALFQHLHVEYKRKDVARIKFAKVIRLRELIDCRRDGVPAVVGGRVGVGFCKIDPSLDQGAVWVVLILELKFEHARPA